MIERLTASDIAAMANRTRVILAPEGAQSWYVNDVTRLIDEVTALRTELEDAKSLLADDGVDRADLQAMTDAWKAKSSGVYTTKRYARLAEELRAARKDTSDATFKVKHLEERVRARESELADARDVIVTVRDSAEVERRSNAELMKTQAARISELEDVATKLNDALVDCQARCEQVLAMQEAQAKRRMDLVVEQLQAALEAAGGM